MNTNTSTEGHRWSHATLRSTRTATARAVHRPQSVEAWPTTSQTPCPWVIEFTTPPKARRACLPVLIQRFQERKIVQWTVAYLVVAGALLQLTDVLSGAWGWSAVVQQAVSLLLGYGILPAMVVAWFHGEKGRQDICAMEAAIVAASIMGSVFAVWSFCLSVTA